MTAVQQAARGEMINQIDSTWPEAFTKPENLVHYLSTLNDRDLSGFYSDFCSFTERAPSLSIMVID